MDEDTTIMVSSENIFVVPCTTTMVSKEELSFKAGDIIKVLNDESGWAAGEMKAKGDDDDSELHSTGGVCFDGMR